jgi:hypothetical protein
MFLVVVLYVLSVLLMLGVVLSLWQSLSDYCNYTFKGYLTVAIIVLMAPITLPIVIGSMLYSK